MMMQNHRNVHVANAYYHLYDDGFDVRDPEGKEVSNENHILISFDSTDKHKDLLHFLDDWPFSVIAHEWAGERHYFEIIIDPN